MNPLFKRLPRELKSEMGKYIVLFVFITIMIGLVSGFLVASESMKTAYDEGFEKYNIEDGNFEIAYEMDDSIKGVIEEDEVTVFENHYIEKETDQNDSTLRIFRNREEVDLVCVMEGQLPDTKDTIAVDRMYADNNNISVNDVITVGDKKLTVCGLVALSDYSALFQSPSDMMFDAIRFGVAIMTKEGFDSLSENSIHYSYSWKYDDAPKDDKKAKKMSENLLKTLTGNTIVMNYIPQFSNQAIRFAGDDIGLDKVIMAVFLYIVVIMIAFIFAITTGNTIVKESMVIGTLRASGYTKSELVRHYIAMPMIVTLISAIIGNGLGYSWFKEAAATMYYGSYSLPTYITLWNASAFIQTTVVPVIIMFVINLVILVNKLSLSPLKFIRRDLSKKKNKKAWKLSPKIGIMKRFRIKIIFQNIPNYITIFIGIFMANVVLLFGVALPHLLNKNQQDIVANMICRYQYILKVPVESETDGIEKYCVTTLKTIEGKLKSEEVAILGMIPDSKFADISPNEDEIYISNAYAEKFGIHEGETVTLKEANGNKAYCFKVKGIYYYPSSIAVFMNREYFNEIFEKDADYFNGYFSDSEIDDI
ncbi:MAG TPA: ABC transporter permease, partial [Lachnospiraceae bacterium]|nr:ABC transporter permease [Lachnospiraceae bacterium]